MLGRLLTETVPSAGVGIYSGVNPLSGHISRFFVQATIILGITNFFAFFGKHLHTPKVVWEIIGGIILGPSALLRDQWFHQAVFPADSIPYLQIVADIGLTFYLFIIGIELDLKLLMTHAKRTAGIAIVGMTVPFCLGIAISRTLKNNLQPETDTEFVGFFVFIGTALCITAFPVLARILKEDGLIYTRVGTMAMGAAALNDAVAWCLLALAIAIGNGGSMTTTGYIFGTMVGIAAFQLLVMKPFLELLVEYAENRGVQWINNNLFPLVICLLFMSAWFTTLIGLDSIFGAFLFGLTIPRGSKLYHKCREHIEEFVLTFTLPLYFVISGLKTDITLIETGKQGAMIVLVCVIATFGKIIGCGIPAYLMGVNPRESLTIAVLMNTKGLVELIVLNVGLSAGILTTRTFSVMVIMCLWTTIITAPIVAYIYPESMRIPYGEEKEVDKGIEMVKQDEDEDIQIELNSITKRLGVVIESLPEMQSVIAMIAYFLPKKIDSEFAVTAMRFIEPTKTEHDEFIGLNSEGKLIRIDEEATDFVYAYQVMQDPAAKRPDLLPISGFLTAHHIPVNVFRVEGDPIEYAGECKHLAQNNECSLVCIPFRANSNFARNFFWSTLNATTVPILLLVQIKEDIRSSMGEVESAKITAEEGGVGGRPAELRRGSSVKDMLRNPTIFINPNADFDEEQGVMVNDPQHETIQRQPTLFTNMSPDVLPLHRRGSVTTRFPKMELMGLKKNLVAVLVTNHMSDLIALSLISRIMENELNMVQVLLPSDYATFESPIKELVEKTKASFNGNANILFVDMKTISTDNDKMYVELLAIPYDLLIVSFIEPTPGEEKQGSQRGIDHQQSVFQALTSIDSPTDFRKQSQMPAEYVHSNLEYPSLGVLGSKIFEDYTHHKKNALVLIVHEPLKIQKYRKQDGVYTSATNISMSKHEVRFSAQNSVRSVEERETNEVQM